MAESAAAATANRAIPKQPARMWSRHVAAVIGALVLLAVITMAMWPHLVSPNESEAQDIAHRLVPPLWAARGSPEHPLGTDQLGRDVLARIARGGQVSLVVAVVAVGLGGPIGLVLGLISGYYRGRTEALIMGLVDIMQALPFILVAIVIAALIGPGLGNVLVVLVATGWVVFARVAHSQTITVKASEFIEAATALGAPDLHVLRRHILPHLVGPLVVVATLQVGRMMLTEASLSFLGLGVEISRPSWGTMLGVGRNYIWTASWLVTIPGVAVTLTVLAINLVGDWARDLLSPRARTA